MESGWEGGLGMAQAAEVYVESAVYSIDKPFSYRVPEELAGSLQRGCRVLVPFGGGNKKVQGLVAALRPLEGGEARLKPVFSQLDPEPLISEELFEVIEFLVGNTFCTYYEGVKAVLPSDMKVQVVEQYRLVCLDSSILEELPPVQKRVAEFLRLPKTAAELASFLDCRKNPAQTAPVQALLENGLIAKEERLHSRAAPKTVRLVRLAEGVLPESLTLPPKQRQVVETLRKIGEASRRELCYHCGVSEGVARALERKGILVPFEREAEEEPFPVPGRPDKSLEELSLSGEQQAAFEGISALMEDGEPHAALLYGVTGSGKTQVYMKLIQRVLSEGKTAMLLVPEIALTPQTVARFEKQFGGVCAVIHSGLSSARRLQEFERVRQGAARIVIGTRSAVFSPLSDIGMIILDEEGESSYKSDASPRYHAREIAKLRCVRHKAVLVLGSATPSIDSYYRAKRGDYTLFSLRERYAEAELPQVYLVDMREEQRKRNFSPLSGLLQQQLALNFAHGEQSILLINRRGYQSYATCMQCGEVRSCPHCSVAMTYHKANGSLMCHYCGHIEPYSGKCPACGGDYLRLSGAGTQKLEDELKLILPQARLLRMDTDTTSSRQAYETHFAGFARGEYDILLGTQMIAKGLDFPNVTLVGVVSADNGLYTGDYRSAERVFSLITQVVGRSGRSGKTGRAYIQTMDPEHPVLCLAASQNFEQFYEDEIQARKALGYPPFLEMVTFGFSGKDEGGTLRAAERAAEILRETALAAEGIALKVMGIAPAAIYRVSQKYRYRLIVKCRLNRRMKAVIAEVLRQSGRDPLCRGVAIYADVNGEVL